MKEIINENYNLKVDKLYENFGEIYFFVNEFKILVKKVTFDESTIKSMAEISNELYKKDLKISTIILNKTGEFVTKIKNEKIVLIRENSITEKVGLKNILEVFKLKSNSQLIKINNMEENAEEVDYIEKKLTTYNKEYLNIQSNIDYFIGLAENSIQLLGKSIKNSKKEDMGIIINSDDIDMAFEKEYYNPLNIRVGRIELAIANYIKWKIYTDYIDFEELKMIDQEKIDYTILLSYLLFPNYYFNDVKRILNNNKKEKSIKKYTINNKKYINFLKYYINKYSYKIEKINNRYWINLQYH